MGNFETLERAEIALKRADALSMCWHLIDLYLENASAVRRASEGADERIADVRDALEELAASLGKADFNPATASTELQKVLGLLKGIEEQYGPAVTAPRPSKLTDDFGFGIFDDEELYVDPDAPEPPEYDPDDDLVDPRERPTVERSLRRLDEGIDLNPTKPRVTR